MKRSEPTSIQKCQNLFKSGKLVQELKNLFKSEKAGLEHLKKHQNMSKAFQNHFEMVLKYFRNVLDELFKQVFHF